jgi:uncharacterized membrane protein YcaP (DUF421 family)
VHSFLGGVHIKKEVKTVGTVIFRTVVLYALLIAVIRITGKRQIGQMEPSELVVAMMVADLATICIQDHSIPLLTGLSPVVTVLGLELIFSALCLNNVRLRQILCGKPVILIENVRILQKALRKNRITLDELAGHLREKDVLDLKTVQYAILETNGNLSVFLFAGERPATAKEAGIEAKKEFLPVTVVSDGRILGQNLKILGKDRAWAEKLLKSKGLSPEDTYLLTVDQKGKTVCIPKDQ